MIGSGRRRDSGGAVDVGGGGVEVEGTRVGRGMGESKDAGE